MPKVLAVDVAWIADIVNVPSIQLLRFVDVDITNLFAVGVPEISVFPVSVPVFISGHPTITLAAPPSYPVPTLFTNCPVVIEPRFFVSRSWFRVRLPTAELTLESV